jgi:drug/metabolite transporter (DMT)-like permease
MRLAALTALVMTAFAANSILNRMAVGPGLIGATDFALVRALAGAAMLGLLVLARHRALPLSSRRRIPGALGLALYLVGFSTAYIAIDAGIGALILFGGVQLTMFAGAVLAGEAWRPALDRGGAGDGGAGVAGLARGRGGAAASASAGNVGRGAGLGHLFARGTARDRPAGGDGGEFRAGRTALRRRALGLAGTGGGADGTGGDPRRSCRAR